MNTKEKNQDVADLLEKIFSNVNTWLSFAETKNAANIAFVIACISVIDLDNINAFSCIIMILLIISGIASMVSFWSKIGKFMKINHNIINEEEVNLSLFSDIEGFDGRRYLEKVYECYFPDYQMQENKYQLDIANEIVYNAHIACCKYKCFNLAAIIDISALFLFVILFILA